MTDPAPGDAPRPAESGGPGLCGHCENARVIESRRGSRFYRCALSDRDARFPRYPALPVVSCAGHMEGKGQKKQA